MVALLRNLVPARNSAPLDVGTDRLGRARNERFAVGRSPEQAAGADPKGTTTAQQRRHSGISPSQVLGMRSVALMVDENRSCQVFEGGAHGLENGPLDRVAATCSLPSAETHKRSSHGSPIEDTSRERSEKVTALHQGFVGVNVEACVPNLTGR